jgi:hypothetical protein
MKLKLALLILFLVPGLLMAEERPKKKRKVKRGTKQERVLRQQRPITVDSISGPVEMSDTRPKPAPTGMNGETVPVTNVYRPKRMEPDTRTSDHEFALGMAMWQESIDLKSSAGDSSMESQFKGVVLSYEFHSPKAESSWYWLYGAEIGAGTIKGKGEAPVADQFDNQTWTMATVRAGLIIKTTEVSRFGLAMPLTFRKINWVYDEGSGTKASEKKFSAGGSFIYETKLTERGSLRAMFTRQHMWDAHLWSASWAVEF